MEAGTWVGWWHRVHSQEAERDVCLCSAFFLLYMQTLGLGPQDGYRQPSVVLLWKFSHSHAQRLVS